jgi:hypothetical protein
MLMPPLVGSDGSKSASVTPSMPRLRALRAVRRKLATERPGIAVGYWKARKRPSRARLSGVSLSTSRPLKLTWPFVTWYDGWPMSA